MHVHILIWLYDLFFSLDPVFDFAIYVMQVSLFLHTYFKLHIWPSLEVGWRKGASQMPWWGLTHLEWSDSIKWGAKQGLFLKTLWKIPSYLTCRVEVTWFMTVPLLNYPRWHDRHFKVHKCKVRFGISLMLASYLWKLYFTLVLSSSLEASKG